MTSQSENVAQQSKEMEERACLFALSPHPTSNTGPSYLSQSLLGRLFDGGDIRLQTPALPHERMQLLRQLRLQLLELSPTHTGELTGVKHKNVEGGTD